MNQPYSDYLLFSPATDPIGDYFPHLQADLSADSATSPESAFSPDFHTAVGPYSLPSPAAANDGVGMDDWMLWESSKDAFPPEEMFNVDPSFAASPAINPVDLSAATRQLFAAASPSPSRPDDGPTRKSSASFSRKRKSASDAAAASSAATTSGRRRGQKEDRNTSTDSPAAPSSSSAAASDDRPRGPRKDRRRETETSPSVKQASTTSRQQQHGRRPKNKSDHGEVEQRYRLKLNAQIAALRDACRQASSSGSRGNGYGEDGDGDDREDVDDDGRDGGAGEDPALLTKGAILTHAAAHIADLQRRNAALERDNEMLRARVERRMVAATLQQQQQQRQQQGGDAVLTRGGW